MIKKYLFILFLFITLKSISQVSCIVDLEYFFNSTTEYAHFISYPSLSPSTDYVEVYTWDFGDGTLSHEENPIHYYLYPGQYHVCLTIRTYLGCHATKCIDINVNFCNLIIQTTTQNITEHADSNGSINVQIDCCGIAPYGYLWSTGDSTQNIDSLSVGIYTVTVCDILGCCETKTITLTEPPGMHGKVYAGSSLLPEGIVISYFKINDSIVVAESYANIVNGNFTLTRYNAGDYYIYAIPNFDFSQPFFPIYFPTYKSDSIKWESADLYANDSVIIHLKPSSYINLGVGKITGNINYTVASSYETEVYGENWFGGDTILYSNAAKNIPIILFDNNNLPVRYVLSKSNGYFEFNDVKYGTYTVYAEKAGFTTYPPSVTIDYLSPEHTKTQLFIDANHVNYSLSNVERLNENENLHIYPNPASSLLNIEFSPSSYSKISIEFINELGKVVLSKSIVNLSTKTLSIDLTQLSNGFYFLKINLDDYIVFKKVVINSIHSVKPSW